MRSSWNIQVGPTSDDKFPCERHTEEKTQRLGGHVTTKAEVRVMQPQAQGCPQLAELGETKNRVSPRISRGSAALLTPLF